LGLNLAGIILVLNLYGQVILLLVGSNLNAAAWLLLISFIDGKLPSLFEKNISDRHFEIVMAMLDLFGGFEDDKFVGVQTFDLLLHVYCTQIKDAGFNLAANEFQDLT